MEHIAGARRVPAAADPAALGFDADKLAGTRRLIQKYIDRGKIAGAVSLVARRG
ncbi:MAG: serine hydrolase, partial [Bacillota bacterium]